MLNISDVQLTCNHTFNSVTQVNPSCASRIAIIDGCEETIIFQHDYSETNTTKLNCLGVFTYLRMRTDFKTNIVKGVTQAQISADLGLGRMTVIRTLSALRSVGLLTWTGHTKQVSTYYLRPRPSQKREPHPEGSRPIISTIPDTNPGDTNGGISTTTDTNKALLVPPQVHLSDQRSIDDDDDQSVHHHRVDGAHQKPETKTETPSHRGPRLSKHSPPPKLPSPATAPLPAAWVTLKLGTSLDRMAAKALADGWGEANLLAAHEISRTKRQPAAYLSKCLLSEIPTEPLKREVARSYTQDAPVLEELPPQEQMMDPADPAGARYEARQTRVKPASTMAIGAAPSFPAKPLDQEQDLFDRIDEKWIVLGPKRGQVRDALRRGVDYDALKGLIDNAGKFAEVLDGISSLAVPA